MDYNSISKIYIEFLQLRFATVFPFCNYSLIGGILSFEIDIVIRELLIKNSGSVCHDLNTLFGCLLHELGVQVKLTHIIEKQVEVKNFNQFYTFHMFNIIKWKSSKEYLVDVSPFLISCFKPIEIGNEISVSSNCGPNSLFRCIKSNKDNSYFYQEKFQNSND
ncbi:hypothetical protein ACTFIR_005027 [Dictyostelium discoideum]